MEKNYDRQISLKEISSQFNYNRTYISSFFTKNVGISFYDYLTRIRFRHALQQLNQTTKSLTDIANDCGFSDLKTFSYYYKKQFNTLPSNHPRPKNVIKEDSSNDVLHQYLDVGIEGLDKKLASYYSLGNDKVITELQKNNNDLEKRMHENNKKIVAICNELLEIAK